MGSFSDSVAKFASNANAKIDNEYRSKLLSFFLELKNNEKGKTNPSDELYLTVNGQRVTGESALDVIKNAIPGEIMQADWGSETQRGKIVLDVK